MCLSPNIPTPPRPPPLPPPPEGGTVNQGEIAERSQKSERLRAKQRQLRSGQQPRGQGSLLASATTRAPQLTGS